VISNGGLNLVGDINNSTLEVVNLNAANTYAGGTTIDHVSAVLGTANGVPNGGAVTIQNGGAVTLASASQTVGAFHLVGGTVSAQFASRTLTATSFDVQSGTVGSLSSGSNVALAGTGAALTKTTSGTVTLNGTNTYTGATTISAGTLVVDGTLAAGSAVSLSGGTLAGAGTVNGLVTSTGAAGSTISAGDSGSTTALTLTLAGGLNAANGVGLSFTLGTNSTVLSLGSGVFTGSTAAGGLQLTFINDGGLAANTIYTLATFGSSSGLDYTDLSAAVLPSGYALNTSFGTNGFLINGTSLQVEFSAVAVPEPSTWLLSSLGFLPLFVLLRRRRSSVSLV